MNMKSTREPWFGRQYNFLIIVHEHLYVSRKLKEDENPTKFKNSMKWYSTLIYFSRLAANKTQHPFHRN